LLIELRTKCNGYHSTFPRREDFSTWSQALFCQDRFLALFPLLLGAGDYMLSNSHQTIIELSMSETDGAGDSSRAVAQRNRDHSQRAQNRTENALALTKEMPEPCSKQVADAAGILLHEAPSRIEAGADVSLPGAAAPRASEIELKLLVDADRLADFNDAPIVATKARNKGTRKHLKSVYYDTRERTLWHNGLTLRVRQSGARFVQTVKAEFEGNPLQRGEWEANVASIAPDEFRDHPSEEIALRELEKARHTGGEK
jgi:triphosphatase